MKTDRFLEILERQLKCYENLVHAIKIVIESVKEEIKLERIEKGDSEPT